jgi:hypothetical protein
MQMTLPCLILLLEVYTSHYSDKRTLLIRICVCEKSKCLFTKPAKYKTQAFSFYPNLTVNSRSSITLISVRILQCMVVQFQFIGTAAIPLSIDLLSIDPLSVDRCINLCGQITKFYVFAAKNATLSFWCSINGSVPLGSF